MFVTKVEPLGDTLAYSTYLGGTSYDAGYGIALDSNMGSNNAYVTGLTGSTNFPIKDAYQNSLKGIVDVFMTKQLHHMENVLGSMVFHRSLPVSESVEGYPRYSRVLQFP